MQDFHKVNSYRTASLRIIHQLYQSYKFDTPLTVTICCTDNIYK